MAGAVRFSVIIPALNEEELIVHAIRSAQAAGGVEVIVSDGGSSDGTVQLAERAGARVVGGARGRGAQMNRGAAEAHGDVLVFLHADTILPPGWPMALEEALARPGCALAAFSLAFRGAAKGPAGLSAVAFFANLRAKYLGLPLGDQALSLRRSTFDALGGYPEEPLLEDLILVRRAARIGTISILKEPVFSSSRRWRKKGLLRTTLINQLILGAYFLGFSPSRLHRWYQ